MEERDDIRVRLTGPDLHQATVEPRSALRLAHAYFHLVGEAARELDEDLRLEGLWVDDNCATLRTRPSNPDVAEESVELAQDNLAGTVRTPALLTLVQGVGRALKELPEGIGASTVFRRREFTLSVVPAPKPRRAVERLSLRAKVLRAGGSSPMARFSSRSESKAFTLLLPDAETMRVLGGNIWREFVIEMRVRRNALDEIESGELLDLHHINQGDPLEAFRAAYKAAGSPSHEPLGDYGDG